MSATSTAPDVAPTPPPGWRGYAKAIAAALTAGLTALATALADGLVAPVEWIGVALAVIAAAGAVWATPNAGVVPEGEVAARIEDGEVVAGPAHPIPDGEPVIVSRRRTLEQQDAADRHQRARDARGRFARDVDEDGRPVDAAGGDGPR